MTVDAALLRNTTWRAFKLKAALFFSFQLKNKQKNYRSPPRKSLAIL
jgi:hypothetical protein